MKTFVRALSAIAILGAWMAGTATAGAEPSLSSAAGSSYAASGAGWVDPPGSTGPGYRGSILLADGMAFAAALAASVGTFSSVPDDRWAPSVTAVVSLSPLVLTGPVVHLARGNGWRALASLGMRVGFFAAGSAVGAPLRAPCDFVGACPAAMVFASISAAMVAPAILDAVLFTARERSATGRRTGPVLIPMLEAGPDGARLGIGASF